MKKKGKMKNKIIITIILSVFSAMSLTIYLLYSENLASVSEIQKLKNDVKNNGLNYEKKLDSIGKSINKNILKIDSLKQTNNKQEIQGFEMNGKSISVEDLLKILNKTLEENSVLNSEVANDKKIFDILKKDYDVIITRENDKIKIHRTQIRKDENDCTEKLKTLENQLNEKTFVLKQLDNRYKLKYEVKTEGNTIKSTIYNSKVDSALWLYPYYKHKIKIDKNGDVFIK